MLHPPYSPLQLEHPKRGQSQKAVSYSYTCAYLYIFSKQRLSNHQSSTASLRQSAR